MKKGDPPPSAPPPPEFIGQVGDLRIHAVRHRQLSALVELADTWVLPIDRKGRPGSFALSVAREVLKLEEVGWLVNAAREAWKQTPDVQHVANVAPTLPFRDRSRRHPTLIFATAQGESDRPSEERAADAMLGAVDLALEKGAKGIVLPVVGCGDMNLAPPTVLRRFVPELREFLSSRNASSSTKRPTDLFIPGMEDNADVAVLRELVDAPAPQSNAPSEEIAQKSHASAAADPALELRRAIEHHEQQLAITRETGDRRAEGVALGNLGIAYGSLGETRRAIEHHEQQLAITREIGDRRAEGVALGNLGIAYRNLGETRRAIEHHEQQLAIARETGDRQAEGVALGNLGMADAVPPEPRRNALVQPLTNDAAMGPDRLGVKPEAYALAEAIASKELEPPLVVGVLGGWGSGKSFVLKLIVERLHEIRSHPLKQEGAKEGFPFAFVGHPYVIKFDAWTYAKSNLWASLMQTVFCELDRQISFEVALREKLAERKNADGTNAVEETTAWRALQGLDHAARTRLLADPLMGDALRALERGDPGKQGAALWKKIEALRKDERVRLDQSRGELAEKRATLEQQRAQFVEQAKAQVSARAHLLAFESMSAAITARLGADVAAKISKTTGIDAKELQALIDPKAVNEKLATLRKAFDTLGGGELRRRLKTWSWVPFALFAALASAVPFIAGTPEWTKLVTIVAGLAAPLARFAKMLDEWHQSLLQRRDAFEAEVARVHQRMEQEETALAENLLEQARRDPKTQEPSEFAKLERAVADLEAGVAAGERRVGLTARYRSLVEFVRGRLESGDYEKRLGLLHRVKLDLDELSDCLLVKESDAKAERDAKKELFPRGMPRVVLVVDDLDRCPPRRVVEVLEAAQLLVKTRLFVVVLAMDVRYITRSLEKVYKGVLKHHGDPSGLDYLEKIVQVPYRVRAVDPRELGKFIRSNVKVREETPAGPAAKKAVKVGDNLVVTGSPPFPGAKVVASAKAELEFAALDDGGAGEGGEPPPPDTEAAPEAPAESPPEEAAPAERRVDLPTEVLQLTNDDVSVLEIACQGISDLSPRAIKRVTNSLKLMKIVWYRRGADEPAMAIKQVLLSLLAVAARYPEVIRPFLRRHELALARGETDASPVEIWTETYAHAFVDRQPASSVRLEIGRARELLADPRLFPPEGWKALRDREDARLVSTFSFLGEDVVGDDVGSLRDGNKLVT